MSYILSDILSKKGEPKKIRSSRVWNWDGERKLSLTWLWCECIAWYRLPSWLSKSVVTIYNSKNGTADMFYDKEEMENCIKTITEKISADANSENKLISEIKMEQDKLIQVATDIESTKLGPLPDEIMCKVYEIFSNQHIEFIKFNNVVQVAGKILNGLGPESPKELRDALSEIAKQKDGMDAAVFKSYSSSAKLFGEIAKRINQKEPFVMSMTPEEINYSLRGGIYDDWEILNRPNHFILLYDLEKDDPMVYTGEKARVMEVSFKFEKK